MKVTFDTGSYMFSHGVAPKGKGLWIFEVTFSDRLGSYTGGNTIKVSESFTNAKREAKREALAEARTVGACREVLLNVQP